MLRRLGNRFGGCSQASIVEALALFGHQRMVGIGYALENLAAFFQRQDRVGNHRVASVDLFRPLVSGLYLFDRGVLADLENFVVILI